MMERTICVCTAQEFEVAFGQLSDGGVISVSGRISLRRATLPRHTGVIVITGDTLAFDSSVTLTLGGETVFEHVTIELASSGVIAADFHPLLFGDGVEVKCDFSEEANGLYLIGGENNAKSNEEVYEKDTSISVRSGRISRMVGFSRGCAGRVHTGHAKLEVSGDAYVRYLVAGAMGEGAVAGSASLTLSDNATIEAIHMGGARAENILLGDMEMFVYGGDIFRFDTVGLSAVKGKRTLVYDPRTAPDGLSYLAELALIDEIKTVCDINGHEFGEPYESPFGKGVAHTCRVCSKAELIGEAPVGEEGVVFVADGGFGDGSSPYYPIGSYEEAQRKLEDGGIIVIVGKCTLIPNLIDPFGKEAPAFREHRHSSQITVSCVYDGVDYRERGACLFFDSDIDYRMSGPLTFEQVSILSSDRVARNRIIARYNPLVVGEGCRTTERDGYALDLIGGYLKFRFCDFDGCNIDDEYEELVNLSRPLPPDPKIDNLVPIKRFPNHSLRSEAARAFDEMFDEMQRQGLKIPTVTDAVRTYAKQYSLFTGYLCRLRRIFGYDFKKARSVVMRSCAVPTTSEHQYGVAVDMFHTDMTQYGSKKHHYFDITPEWAWVHEFGKNYGIVLRYPPDKTTVTGCIYEAWHFRYVGTQTAKILKARGYVLEEYMGAKLGLLNLDSSVTVMSGSFNSVTPFSLETGLLQLTGKHFMSISDGVRIKEKCTELSEC